MKETAKEQRLRIELRQVTSEIKAIEEIRNELDRKIKVKSIERKRLTNQVCELEKKRYF